jgi:hypothetical protein
MTTLIGLFDDEQKAEEAINALTAADLDDVDFETITHWHNEADTGVRAAPAVNAPSGPAGMAVPVGPVTSWNIEDEEVEYFRRAVQNGGVLITVDVDDDDQVEQVKRILQEYSQKLAVGA